MADIDEHRSDLADAPARTVLDFVPFVGGHHLDGRALIEKFSDAINRGLPGFRYDRRAHVTDKYFLEFVRRTSHGFNMIEIQRYVRPHGFSVRLAVSRFRIPFADLMPGARDPLATSFNCKTSFLNDLSDGPTRKPVDLNACLKT